MDFSLSEEQLRGRASVIEFASTNLNVGLAEREASSTFDRAIWKQLADFGVLKWNIPLEYGGFGHGVVTSTLLLEALGYGCRDSGLNLAVAGQMWTVQQPIISSGSAEQQATLLPALGSGSLIGAHAITEPGSGSDTFSLSTVAEPSADGFRLTGTKALIGMAAVADLLLVFAKTDPDMGHWGISAFLVEVDNPGVDVSTTHEKMGLRTNPTTTVTFDEAPISHAAMLGTRGAGVGISTDSLEWERAFILAWQIGAMERQLEMTIDHAKQREQFGQPIGRFQSVANRIVDMRLRLETARLLLYKTAWLKESGRPAQLESALAKLHIAEEFVASGLDAVRTFGGIGYLTETGVERDLRDAVGGLIYGGTSDIQRQVVARLLGL